MLYLLIFSLFKINKIEKSPTKWFICDNNRADIRLNRRGKEDTIKKGKSHDFHNSSNLKSKSL